jgi:hypothetical protein
VTGNLGSPVTVANAGNRRTPVTFRIYGPCVDPLIFAPAGGSISLTGAITAGNYVEIDTQERTLELNGKAGVYEMMNAPFTNWSGMEAPPGNTVYELAASSATAAKLEALYRSAYA